ncbi:MAG: EVE domain-containing protein [Proteobacteria bacterium]|nr:EVE domain-containing protein [Pseudomonadota bacterium]
MAYWLVKSEPEVFSIDAFKASKVTQWDAVRNYQARNYLQSMKVGDEVLFYHSNAEPTGVAGMGKVKKTAYPDILQFNRQSDYFEPRASKEKPVWYAPDIQFVRRFKRVVTLSELRAEPTLKNMLVLKRGMRLSVQPVTQREFERILKMSEE